MAQVRLELVLVARNGESLLLTLGIPVAVLVFFSLVDVLPIDGDAVDFLAPGTLALAVLATAFTNLAIATGFDRSYGVLKRLGATPLGRPRLVAAKGVTVLAIDRGAGRRARRRRRSPSAGSPTSSRCPLVAATVLAVAAFVGLGAGARRAGSRRSCASPPPTPCSSCCCCCRAWSSRSTNCRRGCAPSPRRCRRPPWPTPSGARWPTAPTSRPGLARPRGVGGRRGIALAVALFRWEPGD